MDWAENCCLPKARSEPISDRPKIMIAPPNQRHTVSNKNIVANFSVAFDQHILANINTLTDRNRSECPKATPCTNMEVTTHAGYLS